MIPPRLSAGLAACLLLAACQREAAPPVTAEGASAAPTAAVSVPAPASGPAQSIPPAARTSLAETGLGEFRIVAVLLGNSLAGDNLVAHDAATFARGDTLHASVLSTGAHQGLRLSARWLGPDGAVIADTAQPLVPTAATATTFTLSNPQAWPPGEYRLQVSVNGQPGPTRKFTLR